MGEFKKSQLELDQELEQPANKDRLRTGLKNVMKVIVQEYKALEAEFEEEKKLHEQENDDF